MIKNIVTIAAGVLLAQMGFIVLQILAYAFIGR